MKRRRSRRKKIFKLKLKKESVYTIISVILCVTALLIGLSFFQSGTALDFVKDNILYLAGWGAVVVPVILVLFALLFLGLRLPFTKPNIPIGLLLTFISLLSLTRSGFIGSKIWLNFSEFTGDWGAFFILLGMSFIGLIVLFNTSIPDIISYISHNAKSVEKGIDALKIKSGKKGDFVKKIQINTLSTSNRPSLKNPSVTTAAPIMRQPVNKPSPNLPAKENTMLAGIPETVIANMPSANAVWEYPPLSLLHDKIDSSQDKNDIKQNAAIIEQTLESFGIAAKVAEYNQGPAVTQYALEIAMGTKLTKITALANDLALALAAPTGQIRIEAPIPGRKLVGVEIPNKTLEYVTLKEMLSHDVMLKDNNKLTVALGLDVSGRAITANIAKMPHVLVAGTTGSGKSILMHSWISSLLFRTTPQELRLILVDPKRVELSSYNGIPHLLTPVIVEPEKTLSALRWAIKVMQERYKLFAEMKVRSIESYNEISGFQALPNILIFIDELADLMFFSPVEVEDAITRLAQLARATGIHLVLATQRPSIDVITGLIKANIPARIAFNVSTMIDSRVILDTPGAEKLLGRGDMLYIPPDQPKPQRIQGAFVSEKDVSSVVDFLKNKNLEVEYTEEVTKIPNDSVSFTGSRQGSGSDDKDNLYNDALRLISQSDKASASLLQRKLSIGYARAARILDQLEANGIVGPADGSKARDVILQTVPAQNTEEEHPV